MTQFASTNTTTHTNPGTPSVDGNNTYYAQCFDVVANLYSPLCYISFDVDCSSSTIGATCTTPSGITGTCGIGTGGTAQCIPICYGATPQTPPNIAAGTPSVTIGMLTKTISECRYSPSVFATADYASQTTFANTNDTTHTNPNTPSADGYNAYYAMCYDVAATPGKEYSSLCSIPFTQGCSSSSIGATCITGSGTLGTCGSSTGGTLYCVPVCSDAVPKTPPNLPSGTTWVTIGMTTDTNSECRFSDTTFTSSAFGSQTLFTNTNNILHTNPNTPSIDGKNAYFAMCYDGALSKYSQLCSIPFTVSCSASFFGATCLTPSGTLGTCGSTTGGALWCIPVCKNPSPKTTPISTNKNQTLRGTSRMSS